MKITYDNRLGLAKFDGPGGFTQIQLTRSEAAAIANALGVPFNAR